MKKSISFGLFVGMLCATSIAIADTNCTIDVKPNGAKPNDIQIKKKNILPVAIVGAADCNVNEIDPSTIGAGGAAPVHRNLHYRDVTGPDGTEDGIIDLLVHFSSQAIPLTCASTEVIVDWESTSGVIGMASDEVNPVGKACN